MHYRLNVWDYVLRSARANETRDIVIEYLLDCYRFFSTVLVFLYFVLNEQCFIDVQSEFYISSALMDV